jgi:hypothetical protein
MKSSNIQQGYPSASFKFNNIQEIKSHSSVLYNERMAILFYLLDMKSIDLNTNSKVDDMLFVRSVVKQIYKNIRMLLRYNPVVRAALNLDTKDDGIYVTDITLGIIDRLIEYCEFYGYTTRRVYIIISELNNMEQMIKDVMQYFHYFIRPDFKQKPDIERATEKYKEIADKATLDELKRIVGKKTLIDFTDFGTERIELKEDIEYDPVVDGEAEEVEDE